MPVKATSPPVRIAKTTFFLFTFILSKPASVGTKNAPEKTVSANSRVCIIDVIKSAITILEMPIITIKSWVIFSAFFLFRLPVVSSLKIIAAFSSVVPEDIIAESKAAINNP